MEKRIALITGATAGIGEAVALRLAQDGGYKLIITGRRAERLEALATRLQAEYQAEVLSLAFDVRDRVAVEQTLGHLPEAWQAVDVLINNAGLALDLAPIPEGKVDDWERMIDTNIKGLLYVTRTIAPLMQKRRRGHIINISSIASREVYSGGGVYCATKHAVSALTKGLRLDLVPYGVKVSQVAPGAVETEFSIVRFSGDKQRADSVYQGYEPLTGADVADSIHYLLSAPEHVCIDDLLIMPKAQANIFTIHRESGASDFYPKG